MRPIGELGGDGTEGDPRGRASEGGDCLGTEAAFGRFGRTNGFGFTADSSSCDELSSSP